MSSIRIVDLEVENIPYYGQVASPFHPDNYIVAPGWRDDHNGIPGAVQHRYFRSAAEAELGADWFNLDGIDYLVAHNATFEIQWFLAKHREEFEKFLKRGGRVLCTAMAEYLLSNFTETYPSLDETAPKYGGTHKIDAVKLLWEQGLLTSQIDPDLLVEYLAGPSGDIENTARCFYGQMNLLVARGQWRMYLERCDALLAFAYCTFNGLKVDLDVAYRNLAEQQQELADLRKQADALLPDLPDTLKFNWGSDYHVSALLFGGSVKYEVQVPRTNEHGIIYEKSKGYYYGEQFVPHTEAEKHPAEWPLQFGPLVVYRAGKNKGLPKEFDEVWLGWDGQLEPIPQTKKGEALFYFPGLVPIDGLPAHLQENFEDGGDWVGKRTLADGTPVYSTSSEVMATLAVHGFGSAKVLSRMAELQKDNSTYYLVEEVNAAGEVVRQKGMLQYVMPDGIVHHNLNVTATSTGRLSSSQPNLQNLPRGDKDDDGKAKSRVKDMFVSRFGSEGSIIEVDYSALEVVMLAALSGDRNLLDQLQAGTDMHCLRLAAKLGESYDDVRKKCKDETHPEHQRYHQMRTNIKPVSFAAQYGATARGIAYATGCTVEYAEEFIATEAKLFPESIAFRQVVRDQVELTGALPENLQREQCDDGSWRIYRRGYWQSPGGTRYSFRQYPKRVNGKTVMDYKDTQIANYGIQGEAFFLMAVSMGRILRWMLHKDFWRTPEFPNGRAFLINNVHDAAYADAHESVVREVALGIKAIMEDAPRYMSAELGYSISHVPFPAAAEAGPNMGNKRHVV